jgi:3-dehydroquinate dehydratase-1
LNAVADQKRFSRLVGVVASELACERARRLRIPPDFFELRLDALSTSLGKVRASLPHFRAPIILTVRHAKEGGFGSLTPLERESLFRRFLDFATLVDLELRSVRQMAELFQELRRRQIGLLLSHHNFRTTPAVTELHRLTNQAASFRPAPFKLATRPDRPEQLERLAIFLSEIDRYSFPIAVMGMGRLGGLSRRQFDRAGSALTYASIDTTNVEGQPSLDQLRRARRAYH